MKTSFAESDIKCSLATISHITLTMSVPIVFNKCLINTSRVSPISITRNSMQTSFNFIEISLKHKNYDDLKDVKESSLWE